MPEPRPQQNWYMTSSRGLAVVTGASSGIGAATAQRLAAEGYEVVAAARRRERLDDLAASTPGVRAVTLDVTSAESVAELAASLDDVAVLVNNAGGAIGIEPIERADPADWQAMYDTNVLGVLRVTQALLPALERGAGGHVVVTGSIAGHLVYEGGAGYTAAKHGAAALVETLRLELNGRPVRVTEIAPGMVHTEGFSLVRLRGDQAAADRVYEGVEHPLTADDIADCIAFAVTRPAHVNVDLLVVKPLAQAAPHKIARS
jgi:NADP-dependent 3-hydroxy acid dehydrogenase YdfG